MQIYDTIFVVATFTKKKYENKKRDLIRSPCLLKLFKCLLLHNRIPQALRQMTS